MLALDGYSDLEPLHRGRRSLLFRGHRKTDGLPVVVKTPAAEFPSLADLRRLRREYEIGRQTESSPAGPHVVRHLALAPAGPSLALILEDFQGQPLSKGIRGGALSVLGFIDLALDIAEAVQSLHDAALIHRDINPSNVLLSPTQGDLRLCDLGSALRTHERMSALPELSGDPVYAAPEQAQGFSVSIDSRTDIYSLGVILFELLTGRLPYSGSDPLETLHGHLAAAPPSASDLRPEVPHAVARMLLKLLSKNPGDRYSSARGFRADLLRCRRELTTTGRAADFELGAADASPQLSLPDRLYGRERELAELDAAFDRTAQGANVVALVCGDPGVGKSRLVRQLREQVQARAGHFCEGKFEPLRANAPYHAFLSALRTLLRSILTLREAEVRAWREKLLGALGANGQLLTQLLPELELLIGAQPEVVPLEPEQAQARFRHVMLNFVAGIAAPTSPFVIFLDDLQWADQASVSLIEEFSQWDGPSHLMFVSAFRENELHSKPRLQSLLNKMSTASSTLQLKVGPLELQHVEHLVVDALSREKEVVRPLAELIWRKTGGNPFFVRQFFWMLHNEGLLTFDVAAGAWHWDLGKCNEQSITDNVAQLMRRRIHRLSPYTQDVLRHASCIGSEFSVEALLVVLEQTREVEVWDALDEALREELILAATGKEHGGPSDPANFRFLHDHVQQAAYALIPDAERPGLHLAIGRLLLKTRVVDEREGRIFQILDHLIHGIHLVTQQAERTRIAQLCLSAGRKAKSANAYVAAARYLRSGLELLGPGGWRASYDLALELHREYAETSYLNGDFTTMTNAGSEILAHAKTLLDRMPALQMKLMACIARHEMSEAITVAREALQKLGINLPTAPSKAAVGLRVARMSMRLRSETDESLLGRSPIEDPKVLAAMQILSLAINPAYLSDPNLFPVITCEMMNLVLKHGNSEWSTDPFIGWGAIQIAIGAVERGYRVGSLAPRVVERLGAVRRRGRTESQHSLLIRHWKEPLRSTIEPLRLSIDDAVEHGELYFASVAAVTQIFYMLVAGHPLAEVEELALGYEKLIRRLGQERFERDARRLIQLTRCLQGRAEDPKRLSGEFFDESEALRVNQESGDRAAVASLSYERALLLYVHGDLEAALDCCRLGAEHIDSVIATVYPPALDFLSGLVRTHLVGQKSVKLSRNKELREVHRSLRRLEKWAKSAPENQLHRVHLLRAEVARLDGDAPLATKQYERAVDLAGRHGYLNEQAIALECAGRFYTSLGQTRIAATTLRAAHDAWSSWGASVKAAQLESEFSMLLASTGDLVSRATLHQPKFAGGVGRNNLDLASVMKASQAIVGEIRLPNLVRRLLTLAMENTGAQRGFLLLDHGGQLRIEAAADVDDRDAFANVDSMPLASQASEILPVSIVEYVARVVELVVHADVSSDPMFAHDPYVAGRQPLSVLCVPLVSQGVLGGIVYLENNRMRGAFNAERVEVLHLISSLAAISLENARLYEDVAQAHALQTRVAEAQARFVPTEFLRSLDRESIVDVKLGDNTRKEMSVLFSDLRGFTQLVETMSAQEHIGFINGYLGHMEPAIVEHGGFVDSYMGDGIMALFEGRADNAVRAAVRMSQELWSFNRGRSASGLLEIGMGIGISSGPLTLGTIGGPMRIKCGVIGDPVNLASRVESLTKQLGCSLLISHYTRELLEEPQQFNLRLVDRVRVHGSATPLTLFEVLDAEPAARVEAKQRTLPRFVEAMETYRAGEFQKAERLFHECLMSCPDDGAAATLAARSRRHLAEPPASWNGVDNMTKK